MAVGVIGVLVASAGLAWACTAQPRILSVSPVAEAPSPTAGPSTQGAKEVDVRGASVGAQAPVEIRWNAATGPIIGVATADADGNFAATATIPDVAPGVYYLVAAAGDVGIARAAYEVTAPASPSSSASAGPADLWATSPATAPSAGPGLMLGTGLLAVGVVALFSGFTVAALRRRTVLATTRRHTSG